MSADDRFDALIDAALDRMIAAPREALARADEAMALCADDDARRARALWARGLALGHAGDHGQGLAELSRSLAAVPEEDLRQRAIVLRALAIVNELLGALDASLEHGLASLSLARRLADATMIADGLLSVGVVYSRNGDPQRGLDCYGEVLAMYHALDDPARCIPVLNNMGINCKNLGRHDEAVAHFERALALAEGGSTAPATVAVLHSNLAEPLWQLGRLDEARTVLERAVGVLSAAGYSNGETHARVLLGRILLAAGEPQAARAQLERGVALADGSGGMNYAAQAHLALCELHKAAGRFDAALTHHEAFHAAERTQFNADSQRRLQALRVQHELADAQREAETHRLRHVELERAHAQLNDLHRALVAADEDKNRLLERLARQSRTDALTGLANRRHLDERLADEFARAKRHRRALAVAMCDIDFFKRINDRLGHAIGDEVLRHVAAMLRERCRATDIVARYGGEEFCIVFLEANATTAAIVCEDLRAAIEAYDWRRVHADLTLTLSIGIADEIEQIDHHERLLVAADRCLYAAKEQGKNRVCWGEQRPAPETTY